MTELNKEFQAKYPNITIKRVSRSFDDLKTTLKLALLGQPPPDVVQANNGRPDMGSFVQAGQLVPAGPATPRRTGGPTATPSRCASTRRTATDGKTFGDGQPLRPAPGRRGRRHLLQHRQAEGGRASTSRRRPGPTSRPASPRPKAKGELPLVLGNLDKWPAIHVFGTVQGPARPAGRHPHPRVRAEGRVVEDAREHQGGADPGRLGQQGLLRPRTSTARATTRRGRRSPRARASTSSPAPGCRPTSEGHGLTTWFMLPPPAAGNPVATGGTGIPWAVSSKSKHPDAAAAYINFITSPDAMAVLAKNDNLPIADTAEQQAPGAARQGRSSRPSARRSEETPWCPTSTTRRRPWRTPSAPPCRTCWRRRRRPSSSSTPLRRTTAGSSPRTA